MKLQWIFSLIFLSQTALAVVDMKNASYVDVWTDLIAPGPGYDLKIRRGYKSRSLFNGIFGFGWCSDIETHLKITPEGNLKLTECGAGVEIVYMPKSFSTKEVDKTVQQIIVAHKKEHRTLKKSFYRDFAKSLKGNIELRSHFSKLYKIKKPLKSGAVFLANGKQVDKITFAKGIYTRYLVDNTVQRFNSQGSLIHISDKNGNYLKLSYDKSKLLRQVHDNNGRKLAFKYFLDSKKVKEVTGPHGLKVQYTYRGQDLASVKNAWGHSYSYKYDDLHNLVRINFPDNTYKELKYDKDKDWVVGFRSRKGCFEKYDYKPQADDPQNHYISSVVKKCGKKITSRATYEFWHKRRKDGQNYLARVKSTYGSDISDITYHPVFGKPTIMGINGKFTYYTYYSNGLIKSKEVRGQKTFFNYNTRFNKVARVTVVDVNKKGKVIKKIVTNFRYNGKANLEEASNSLGQKVKISYDSKGRIAQLVDQAKRLIKVKYEKRFGKPAFVERVGVGSIKITYKANGDIKNVKSKDGPIVASQVSQAFNGLLEMIEPANEEFKI